MKIEQLFKALYNNNGFTVNKKLEKVSNLDYIVSTPNFETQIPLKLLTFPVFQSLIREYTELVEDDKYIGVWIDNDIAYFDVSVSIIQKDLAIELGKMWEQKAIYDYKNNQSIYLTV